MTFQKHARFEIVDKKIITVVVNDGRKTANRGEFLKDNDAAFQNRGTKVLARHFFETEVVKILFNIAGLNTAFAVIENHELRWQVQESVINAGLGSGNVFGITALIAAYQFGSDWLIGLMRQLKENSDRVCRFFAADDLGIDVTSPEATFLLWLDCRKLMQKLKLNDDTALSAFFVEQAGLGLNPGVSFGQAGSGFMRLNIGCPANTLTRSLHQLRTAILSA